MPQTLERLRQDYHPPVPKLLQDLSHISFAPGKPTSSVAQPEELKKLFPRTFGRPIAIASLGKERARKPLRIGAVFSGGQAAGGHNVIAGLFDALPQKSALFGFLNGPSGLISGAYKELTRESIAPYRNQGGFDLLGSGRTKIETPEQFSACLKVCQNLKLDGLVIIGGDDSNTNAALLAEFFLSQDCATQVIGVPKTIDGDLQNPLLPISFGFDTACKVYAELIGNIARDAVSAKKYYHFIRLMGRSASHIALECALSTHPNLTLIGEEKKGLDAIVQEIVDLIAARAAAGKKYGVILIPEGIIEFIPEFSQLLKELNQTSDIKSLTPPSRHCFAQFPEDIQNQLLIERDPHGNVQVSLIETERMLIELVRKEIDGSFNAVNHFLGYEGRSGFPSNFDAAYCYALGMTAVALIETGHTGYMGVIPNLRAPIEEWTPHGLPLTMLMHVEQRSGKQKPVIQKALVDLKGKPFQKFASLRNAWKIEDHYSNPGPIQFFGPKELTDSIPHVLDETINITEFQISRAQ